LAGVNFSQSCTWWGGTYGTFGANFVATLQATCRTVAGAYMTTSLDLNTCIINASGYLLCRPIHYIMRSGGFLGSCQPTNSPSTGDTYLQATCLDGQGGNNRASIDLDTCVGNADGVLVC
ncbi:Cyanovirin-N, partial [Cyathus striatus]